MRLSNLLAAGVGAAILAGSPASAAVMMATFYASTDFGGYDYAGLFGAPGSSLAYKAATLSFTYDTALGDLIESGGQTLYGGTIYGSVSPIISASVTIGEVTHALDLSYYGYVSSQAGAWTWLSGKQETPGNIATEFSAQVYYDASGDLETPFLAYASGGGSLRIYKPDDYAELLAETDFNLGGVEVTYVGPSAPGPVPEPTTWALMIAGFGLAGAALRRRRALAG
jgi:hypothetical protein